MPQELTTKTYWESVASTSAIQPVPKTHQLRIWLERVLHDVPRGNCFEIGAYPGRFLALFGELGFTVHGLDYVQGFQDAMKLNLSKLNIPLGEFYEEDFLSFQHEKQYQLVFSAGFVEHFENFPELLKKHCDLVDEQGTLVVTVPNFAHGLQYLLHRWLDKTNLERHYLPAMDLDTWSAVVANEGFSISYCGPIGYFDYWYEDVERSVARSVNRIIKGNTWLLSRVFPSNTKAFSPFLGIVARRER